MRVLLSKKDKLKLIFFLKRKYLSRSLSELSENLNMPLRTLQNWLYIESRYIPEEIIPQEMKKEIKINDTREDNWGKVKGGKKAVKVILQKYGVEEIRKRQSNGGRISKRLQLLKEKPVEIDLNNHLFLEFYGILLGDGWLSKLKWKNKKIWLIGISGNMSLDRDFFKYCQNSIKILFNRRAYLKERPKQNSIELNFSHKNLIDYFNKKLDFPIGKKKNLKIHEYVYKKSFGSVRHVIRGIFDTDGSFYFDKTPAGKPYPCISIKMKAKPLMTQIRNTLLKQGFRLTYTEYSNAQQQIKLKGRKQLDKWMSEIGSNNSRHLNKIALVAQPGLEQHTPNVQVAGSNPALGV